MKVVRNTAAINIKLQLSGSECAEVQAALHFAGRDSEFGESFVAIADDIQRQVEQQTKGVMVREELGT